MGTDKNADVLWVGNSWGGSLARIDTKTVRDLVRAAARPDGMQPYHIAVDKNHNAWLNIWTSDVVLRYDPAAGKWTTFDLPTRGTEARYISLLEQDGKMQVVVPVFRTSKIAVMTLPQRGRPRRAQGAGGTAITKRLAYRQDYRGRIAEKPPVFLAFFPRFRPLSPSLAAAAAYPPSNIAADLGRKPDATQRCHVVFLFAVPQFAPAQPFPAEEFA